MHKRLSFTLLLVVCSLFAVAQNLLPNPNFAEKTDCPQTLYDLEFCKDWKSATKSYPRYYNACYDSTGSGLGPGVPQSWMAYQHSNSNAYVGMVGFHYGAYREYITATFPALVPGKKYRVSMFVSLGDSSVHASAGLGAYFYKDAAPDYHTYSRIPVTPQIDYTSQGIIANDTEWVALTATFVADSAYDHIVIGNYHHDTDYLLDEAGVMLLRDIQPGKSNINYYLIDSVAVELAKEAAGVADEMPATGWVTVRPNPARDKYTFTFSTKTDHRLTIYNSAGVAVVVKEHIGNGSITLDRGTLPAGNYFYVAESGGNIAGRGHLLLE